MIVVINYCYMRQNLGYPRLALNSLYDYNLEFMIQPLPLEFWDYRCTTTPSIFTAW